MDNTTKNKVIASFMEVIWYDSYVECCIARDEAVLQATTGQKVAIFDKHQWQPEYHTSYDRLIEVVRKLKSYLKEHYGMSMVVLQMMTDIDSSLLYEDKAHLFNLLYETILKTIPYKDHGKITGNSGNTGEV